MKILATSIILVFLLLLYSFANLADINISGVKISSNYSEDIFPANWQDSPINPVPDFWPKVTIYSQIRKKK